NQLFQTGGTPDRSQLISEYIESELLDKDFSDEWKNAWVRREIDTYKAWLVVRESREKVARFLAFMGGTALEDEKIRLGPSPAVQALIDSNIVPDREWWSNVSLGNIQDALEFPDIKNTLIAGKFTTLAEKAQNTALHMAAVNSDLEVMVALIDEGASVNVWNFDGMTPVHGLVALDGLTARTKSNGKLEALIEAGADLDHTDHWGQTALHWACGYWYQTQENELVELSQQQVARKTHPALVLLRAGADTKIRNKMGKTAWDLVQDAKVRSVKAGGYGVGWKDPYKDSLAYQLLAQATRH
ncbi:MAG: ankyrin repeat domain-containing protein, partial [Paracoccaceae bacterium]|nr:ankyrin repeat domain-containing protein [Paracoccaceae bacterium]